MRHFGRKAQPSVGRYGSQRCAGLDILPGIDSELGKVSGLCRFYRNALFAFRSKRPVFDFGPQKFGPGGIHLFLRNDVVGLQSLSPFVVGAGFFISGLGFDDGIARGQSVGREVEEGLAGVYLHTLGRIAVAKDNNTSYRSIEEHQVVGCICDFAAAMNDRCEVRLFDSLHLKVGAGSLLGRKYDFVVMPGLFRNLTGMRVVAFAGNMVVGVGHFMVVVVIVIMGAACANGHTYGK